MNATKENLPFGHSILFSSTKTLQTSDAVKSRSWRLHSWKTIKQVFFIAALGTRGSHLQTCTPNILSF